MQQWFCCPRHFPKSSKRFRLMFRFPFWNRGLRIKNDKRCRPNQFSPPNEGGVDWTNSFCDMPSSAGALWPSGRRGSSNGKLNRLVGKFGKTTKTPSTSIDINWHHIEFYLFSYVSWTSMASEFLPRAPLGTFLRRLRVPLNSGAGTRPEAKRSDRCRFVLLTIDSLTWVPSTQKAKTFTAWRLQEHDLNFLPSHTLRKCPLKKGSKLT